MSLSIANITRHTFQDEPFFMKKNKELAEVAKVFFRLGCIGFGGPAVHIAMMEAEIVRKRKWISEAHFLDLVGATNLIPGPNSTEMTMHCGHERAGWKGLIVGGVCFILPAVIITGVIAWAYRQYGTLPQVKPFLYGIKPAVISVVVALMIGLGKKSIKSLPLAIAGVLAAILALAGFNEILILFGGGFAGVLYSMLNNEKNRPGAMSALLLAPVQTAPYFDWKQFWIFLKIGAILYGSGYVLFAFLDNELVKTGMLSKQQLVDAIAVGQFTPGPVFSSATFIGWQIAGLPGAVAATVGIFLPSFVFVALLNPIIPRLRKSLLMSAFLDYVNVISVALILAICIEMGRTSVTDWRGVLIAIAGFAVTFLFPKLNTAFVILGGAVSGYLLVLI